MKLLLILSPGNAALERDFSVNGDILFVNSKQDLVVEQCLMYDAVKNAGSLYTPDITKQLFFSMRSVNASWKQALDDRRSKLTAEEKAAREKMKLQRLLKNWRPKNKSCFRKLQKNLLPLMSS
ncbi:hypothetical protein PR048_021964 [Dryococelus australis]|uniref:Uncharacterized protein n=1 Tax=Dryococelus australis TaxID=614101 RepID=A0ABQ9GZP5_9NEOP|nr:hypothetical protein PR048_021964 [Dryococelus australis]